MGSDLQTISELLETERRQKLEELVQQAQTQTRRLYLRWQEILHDLHKTPLEAICAYGDYRQAANIAFHLEIERERRMG